ncbi:MULTISPECIES: Xaa-Pro peptidase family protein [unclassified Leucobacter]|uniref:M24 family metallopeptidase n=1 Tax=unclassified Leucobacter TaxID=2621730 RepID=UPI00165E468C|nr:MULTISPECIES: M24 family metallopeptidase [unclassified Leucobacter]MBC9936525.1 aminopeptidase P family protein [Leucobacter sp. cx-87]
MNTMSPDKIASIKARVASDYRNLDSREPDYAFSSEEYAGRRSRLRAELASHGVDTLILSSPDGMCWLHGYESRWHRAHSPVRWMPLQMTALRVSTGEAVHFDVAHHRHLLRLSSVVEELRLGDEDGRPMLDLIVRELSQRGWLKGTVGLELGSHVPNRATSETIEAAFASQGSTIVDATTMVRAARKIKSVAEIEALEEAARICDFGLEFMRHEMRPGMTERQAWGALVRGMAEAGGGPAALHESVVVGPIELGHAYSSDRVIKRGDVLCADPSGVYKNYHANIERWYVVGEDPSDALLDLAAVEAKAFEILCSQAAHGTRVQDVTDRIQEHLTENGLWGLHNWNGGYEMGLSFPPDWVGEWTFTVGEQTNDLFETGTVTNYESIVLYPMIDTVVFGESGARTLSQLPLNVLRAG